MTFIKKVNTPLGGKFAIWDVKTLYAANIINTIYVIDESLAVWFDLHSNGIHKGFPVQLLLDII